MENGGISRIDERSGRLLPRVLSSEYSSSYLTEKKKAYGTYTYFSSIESSCTIQAKVA